MANARLIEIQFGPPIVTPFIDTMQFTWTNSVAFGNGNFCPIDGIDGVAFLSATNIPPKGATYMTMAGTIDRLTVTQLNNSAAPGTTYTMYKGGVAQTITITIPNGSKTASDLTHSFHVNQGDVVGYFGPIGNNTLGGVTQFVCRFIPD